MTDDTTDLVSGILILVVALPTLYFAAQLIIKIGNLWTARILAPLAPILGKNAKLANGSVSGSFNGCQLRAFYAKDKNDGWDMENSTGFNAFYIEAADVPGQLDWKIQFHVSGLLGQGPKELHIHVADKRLGERLAQAGVIDAVAKVSTPTEDYVTVAFDARRNILTYTDDVSPKSVPSRQRFEVQLELLTRLVEINEKVNRI